MDTENTTPSEQPLESGLGFKKVSGFKKFLRRTLILGILVLAFCFYWFFYNVYSNGERTGILIKVTHKGNVFKTNEGEMWLSCRLMTNPEKFYFSVTNDSIYQLLKNLQDECVQLEYKQYRATIPWRGDSKYIITGVVPVPANRN
ncbi:MAG TPA: hypothetical protein PLU37_07540 [Chitinophagaceae bacterium]|nr:hypothetical protein [Chitinophagaceae bacterium]MCB9054502.1 hypothetical protein [Chitinophagales bacterium]HPG11365.1 hypothetical protein [Chitinophagaceae bacterium]HRX93120.1 hypothetical protein [Chitinophagaceae bacterium]